MTEFYVAFCGTLSVVGFAELETRAEYYESVADSWSRSPDDLANALDECEPLAWEVHSIYSAFRDALEAEVLVVRRSGVAQKQELAAMEARLEALPEEPMDGAVEWLVELDAVEFKGRVVPLIQKWFGEPPDWNFEQDYLPESSTAQGAALEFFRSMAAEELETLGVDVVEGEHPGSSYYAAELQGDIDEANRAAEAAGIEVRFIAADD